MAGRYQRYPEYKDSGIEWLKNIPKDWNTIQIGRCYKRIKRTGFEGEELLSVYRDYGVIPKSSRDDNNNKPSEDLTPYQLVKPDNLVMNKMKAWQGSIAISQYRGIVSPAYFVYEAQKKSQELFIPKYVHYLLRNPMYVTQYLSRSKGIRVNQWDLDPDEFQRIELLLPSLSEQKQIISFLDHEIEKIDTLIAKQEKLIELLKEKRQAVISHAVTKGLNPDVPMKDSGVEWLGEVPEHWGIVELKRCCKVKSGFAFDSQLFIESGIPVIRIGDINIDGSINLENCKFVDSKLNKAYTNYQVQSGDILMAMTGATIGKAGWYKDKKTAFLNQRVGVFNLKCDLLIYKFLWYILKSSGYQSYISLTAFGGAQPNISDSKMVSYCAAIPPNSEQIKIINFLDQKLVNIDVLIVKQEKLIELLKEKSQAIIYDVVTGKIDVRTINRKRNL